MNDFKLPKGRADLPPGKKLPLNEYLEFVRVQWGRMSAAQRQPELSRRPLPAGKRFELLQ